MWETLQCVDSGGPLIKSGHYKFVLIIEGRTAVRPSGLAGQPFSVSLWFSPIDPELGVIKSKIEERFLRTLRT